MKSISLCLACLVVILGLTLYTQSIKHKWHLNRVYKTNYNLGIQIQQINSTLTDCSNEQQINIQFNKLDWILIRCQRVKTNVWR